MSNVTFDAFGWIHLVWVVAGLLALGVYGVWQRRRALRLFASLRLLEHIAPPTGWFRPLLRLGLVTLCLLTTTAAIMGPRWGESQEKVVKRGIDVLVLLDVSRSMLARDIAPNRLERAKLSIRDDLLPALAGDRIGLIAFAGVAALKCPLTSDYGFFRLALDEVSTGSSPRGGTLIGDAIRKASKCFDDQLDTHRVVLLITDGEDQESYPEEAARALWQEQKIPVVCVALGDERDGARIPADAAGQKFVEHGGQTVWSKADFGQLRRIADISDLRAFIPVGTRDFNLGEIYRSRIVPAIRYRELVGSEQVQQPSQYHRFAVLALVLLAIDSFLREGRLGRAQLQLVIRRRRVA
ncbi:MAG: hypothetical protein CHACPFDD_02919 [Phycisphaerae bacterium]|nr:hypothetical protein [Phycisphaerae bacterium]